MRHTQKITIFLLSSLSLIIASGCSPTRDEAIAYHNFLRSIEISMKSKLSILDGTFRSFDPQLIEVDLIKAQKKAKELKGKVKRLKTFHGNAKLRKGLAIYIRKVEEILHQDYPKMLHIYQIPNYTEQDEERFEIIQVKTLVKLRLADRDLQESKKVFIRRYNLIPDKE